MSKKYNIITTLVIVESPAKCKKIEEYLGPGYKCLASFGHLRELSSLSNIDFNNQFYPKYSIIDNALKKKQIQLLKKEIMSAGEVILATDDDREGEAIAWHICDLFHLNIETTKRILFREITKTALQNAVKSPTRINMKLVHSQQARQILDLLIGFKVSSNLRDCLVKNKSASLSAGRCQTPALKIIYDNYNEIRTSTGKKVYNVSGIFTNQNILFSLKTKPENKYETEDQIIDYLNGASEYSHIYNCSEPKSVFKKQPEPFTTSKIQQTASSELHLSPKETMSICQRLYEAGYITYMRTDSKTYSKEFIESVKEYIIRNYVDGIKYINENIDLLVMNREKLEQEKDQEEQKEQKEVIKKKENLAKKKNSVNNNNHNQEAHEAIRPTNVSLELLPDDFDSKEKKLYKLIRENTLESCMSIAKLLSITASIPSFDETIFSYTSEIIDFPGWLIVSKKYSKDTDNSEYNYLLKMKKQMDTPFKKIMANVSIKNLKSHHTEAKLIQILEEKGIGRPSTYSSIVDKIQERGYVKKQDVTGIEIDCKEYVLENDEIVETDTKRKFGNEKGKLVIQPLGIVVIDFLNKHFNDLFEYDYTKQMEDDLDNVSNGTKIWNELCKECDDTINNLIHLSGTSKLEIKLDENNTYIIGKYGPIIKCDEVIKDKEITTFKKVKKDIDIHKLKNGEYSLEDIQENKNQGDSTTSKENEKDKDIILGKYEKEDVIIRKGKFGLYIKWGENTKTLKELGNRPIESITYQDVEKYIVEGSNIIRNISDNITVRRGTKGDYIFFKTKKMKRPTFYSLKDFNDDYKTCDICKLTEWINNTYNI